MSAGDASPLASPRKSRNWGFIAILVVVALAIGFLIYTAARPMPATQLTSSQQSSSIVNTTIPQCSVSASLPCGWTGSSQGILVVTNASLTVSPSTNSLGNGVLSLTLVHTGNYENTTLEVYLQPLGTTRYLNVLQTAAVGPTRTYWASIPTSYPLTRGLKYEVIIDSIYYETGVSGEAVTELHIALTAN